MLVVEPAHSPRGIKLMSRRVSLRLAIAAIFAAAVLPLTTLGQSQDSPAQSVADAARRAREQKKAAAKQPAPVITDDTLKPAAPAAQAANAPTPPQSPEAAPAPPRAPTAQPAADSSGAPDASAAPAPAGQPAPAADAGDTDQKAKDAAEVATLKQQIAEAQKDLDLLQRELGLQQDTYFSNPDHSHDPAGKAKLDAMLEQITDKHQAVDALKRQLAALPGSSAVAAPPAPTAPPQI
jgi:hypothetical protein